MQRVPRYTSYPTAVSFNEDIGETQYGEWLSELGSDAGLSLYIHLPFCRQLCWFCGCNMRVVTKYDPVKRYLGVLQNEARLLADHLAGARVTQVHFGGGSPTVVAADDFLNLIDGLAREFRFDEELEIDLEIDPRTVDKKKISAYAKAGVRRVSLGVQDFDPRVQMAINRYQPFPLVRGVVDSLRIRGIRELNLDLIYGLPHQTLETIEATVDKTLSLAPSRISLFGYAHVPWMKKHQKMIPEDALPSAGERVEMFNLASRNLVAGGYVPIGLDHFAKPDDPLAIAVRQGTVQRNFQGYTTVNTDTVIGLGVSAISSLPGGYAQNSPILKEYISRVEAGSLPACRGVPVSSEDASRRRIIMSLMCNLKVDLDTDRYQQELEQLKPFIESGMARLDHNVLRVEPAGRSQLRIIASAFDQYLPATAERYSSAV